MKRLLSQRGNSLVELLSALAIMGVISVGIGSYLISGFNNFDKINEEVNLKSEANLIMKQFENHIFAAKKIEKIEATSQECNGSSSCSLIKIIELCEDAATGKLQEKEVILGFKDKKAVINDSPIHSPQYEVVVGKILEPEKIGENKFNIPIKLILKDAKHNVKVELETRISYIQTCGN